MAVGKGKGIGKVCCVLAMKTYRRRRGIVPLINFDTG